MYNQRALLADIVITPALQTANQDASPGPTQPQVADSLDGKNGMIPCPNQAGDQSGCHFHGNHASKMPSGSTTALLVPITLREANAFVESHHRHNGRTARNGGKFAVGVEARTRTGEGITLVGVAIVGNPLSATYMDGFTAEVLRVCTSPEAPKNICSMLYSACWRAWRAMGGRRMITYTLQSETGVSLKASGWRVVGETKPIPPGWRKNDGLRRDWQPVMGQKKFRWEVSEVPNE